MSTKISIQFLGLSVFLPSLVAGCAWVRPSVDSQMVTLAAVEEVSQCSRKGDTVSKTLSKFWFIPRSKDKVFTELVTLAKNEASILGGDTVVPEAELAAGTQVFGVYQCRG